MVAVQMGKEDLVELARMHAGGGQAHGHAAPAVEEQVQPACLDEVRRPGSIGDGSGEPVPSKVSVADVTWTDGTGGRLRSARGPG